MPFLTRSKAGELKTLFDTRILCTILSKIREYIQILKEIRKNVDRTSFKDYRHHGLAERYLQLAIEAALDIGNHLISRLGLRKPERYHDIFIILGENGIIPTSFSKNIVKMAGFRNILVHAYLDLDLDIVYDILQTIGEDLEHFAKYIVEFIEKQKTENEQIDEP